jgi:hypothetical protein
MIAAALVPLTFAVGLLVLFALGAWPIGPGTVVAAAVVATLAMLLARYLADPSARP